METVLRVCNITKFFSKRKVIDDVTFETYAGEVFGFLGPNGAGKTTTIKMILGLLSRDSGEIYINETDTGKDYEKAMARIGGIVENPEFYNYMTGLQNLHLYKRLYGVTEERLREVIKLVGLENRITDKVKKYSLGMKQRLGIAQSILHDPALLILDEPTNGLDPAGIKELRDILLNMAHKKKIGVFISSHLLSEMELMCDRVGIIVNGRIIDEKTPAELTSQTKGFSICRFEVDSPQIAVAILKNMDFQEANILETTVNSVCLRIKNDEELKRINAGLISGGVALLNISKQERSLEDIFLEMTDGGGGQIV